MKKITMKDIAKLLSRYKGTNDKEHIDLMQLALFKDKKLSEKEENEVFKHLAKCNRCRDILKSANELEEDESVSLKVANNRNFMGVIKPFIPFAAGIIIFLGIPQGDKYFNENVSTKSIFNKKNIFEESIEYWEELFSKIFKDK